MKAKINEKNPRGITLIALVITIIVMLILVSVTISMAVNGGLFGYAGKAARETEEAKQKELDWLNVEGLSTDQLIAKFTTDRKKDLEVLKKLYTYELKIANNEELTEAEMKEREELQPILTRDMENGELYFAPLSTETIIVYYHGYNYKIEIEYDSEERITGFSIEPYELTEIDNLIIALYREEVNIIVVNEKEYVFYNNKLYKILENEDYGFVEASAQEYAEYEQYILCNNIINNGRRLVSEIELFEYNNNIYELTYDGAVLVGAKNEIAIVYDRTTRNYITITSPANQTWYQWANNPNTEDLDLSYIQNGLTLKALIISVNGQTDKAINFSTGSDTGYELALSFVCYSNESIISGEIYHINSYGGVL